MNYRTLLGTCAVISLLASGCAAKSDAPMSSSAAPSAQAQTGQAQEQKPASEGAPAKQEMNQEALQMSMTFKSLIAMDKTEGLTITKDQAQVMLPIVQESITKNGLSADARTKLLEKLTTEQKKFIDESAAKPGAPNGAGNAANPGTSGGPGNNSGTPANSGGPANNLDNPASSANPGKPAPANNQDQAKKPEESSKPNGQAPGSSPAQANSQDKQSQPGNRPDDAKEIGQQLVQLLQSKLK